MDTDKSGTMKPFFLFLFYDANELKAVTVHKRRKSGEDLTFIGPCIVIRFYSKTNEIHHFLKFILFCSSTRHVSDGLSVHHQESKTVHTASGVCQRDSADCLLAGININ
jgi:hypothetical protein